MDDRASPFAEVIQETDRSAQARLPARLGAIRAGATRLMTSASSEGFDTLDLTEAKALFDELAS